MKLVQVISTVWVGKLEADVRMGLVLSCLVGLIVFGASFQLLGGNLGDPNRVATVFGFMTPSELWASLSGMITIATGVFFTWSKASLGKSLRKFDDNNKADHSQLFGEVGIISRALDILVEKHDTLTAARRSLLKIQDEYSCFVDTTIDPTGKLKEFYLAKCKSFREFATGMIDLGFEDVSTDGIIMSGRANSKVLRDKCEVLLGKDFADFFYASYCISLIEYLTNVTRIINDQDNSTVERVQARSESFMKQFTKELQAAYIAFNKVI